MSKSLAPGLRLGWLVLPPDLLESVLTARNATDHMTASLVQATFAEFLDRGDLDRHLRRTRRLYRQRRDAVLDALGRHLPGATVGGASAGLTAYVTLPPGVDSAAVVAAARGAGIGVYQVDDELMDPAERARTLVLGYGMYRPAQIEDGIARLAAALADQALMRP
jgi:GntR family transcriptional regulator/MocR family aminotransferase